MTETSVRISGAFEESVTTSTRSDNNTTIIELSEFENANTKVPPLVTGTVYQTESLPDDPKYYIDGCPSHDSFRVAGGLESHDEDLEALLNVDKCLKSKVTNILMKNPWLASKIIKSPRHTGLFVGAKERFEHIESKFKHLNKVGELAMEFPTELTIDEARKRAAKIVRVVTTTAVGGAAHFGDQHNPKSTTKRELAAANAPSAINVIIADPITDNKYAEIVEAIRPMVHSCTENVVDSDVSLWDVLLVPLTETQTSQRSNKFLLVHALNSSLADAATFYKIRGMLSADHQIEALDPTRIENLDEIKERLLGEDPNYMRSGGIHAGIAKNLARVGFGKKFHNTTSVWTIDEAKIDAMKECHELCMAGEIENGDDEPPVPYVTTNDILTSWFFRDNQDAAIGNLLADMRGKDPQVPTDKAGNYQAEIVYNTRNKAEDGKTAAWIRASVKRKDELLKRHGEHKLPGNKTLLGGWSKPAPGVTTVTNWSSLCTTLALEHDGKFLLKPEAHLPLRLEHNGTHALIGWNHLLIFRYNEDKLGVLVSAPESKTEDEDLPLDRPALFPAPTKNGKVLGATDPVD
jgi:hypothetical protein